MSISIMIMIEERTKAELTEAKKLLANIFGTWTPMMIKWGMGKEFRRVLSRLDYENKVIYPEKRNIFRIFREVDYNNLKVVLLFQDPYHDGKATGIAVANEGITKISPTLKILYRQWNKECNSDEFDTSLINWCKQGVMPLNAALTVEQAKAGSHMFIWKNWTEMFLTNLSMTKKDIIYVMFGKKAQKFEPFVINGKMMHMVHPAAEMYTNGKSGFLGSNLFTRINQMLNIMNKKEIEW